METTHTENTIVVANLEVVPVEGKQERFNALMHQIYSCHEKINEGKEEMQTLMVNQSNYLRRAGQYLIELKEHVKNSDFQALFENFGGNGKKPEMALPFNISIAKSYIAYAKKCDQQEMQLEGINGKKVINEILAISNVIEKKSKSGERLHDTPSVTELFVDFHMDWNEFLNNVEKVAPQDEWNDDTCMKVKRQLKPIVDFYNSL